MNSSTFLSRRPGPADVVSEAERGGEGLTAKERGRVSFIFCNNQNHTSWCYALPPVLGEVLLLHLADLLKRSLDSGSSRSSL